MNEFKSVSPDTLLVLTQLALQSKSVFKKSDLVQRTGLSEDQVNTAIEEGVQKHYIHIANQSKDEGTLQAKASALFSF